MTIDDARRYWQNLRRRGEYDLAVSPIVVLQRTLRASLETYLTKHVLTPTEWGKMQYLQGRLKACAEILDDLASLAADPETAPPPKRRPESPLADPGL